LAGANFLQGSLRPFRSPLLNEPKKFRDIEWLRKIGITPARKYPCLIVRYGKRRNGDGGCTGIDFWY
jgi:hypothetical protein